MQQAAKQLPHRFIVLLAHFLHCLTLHCGHCTLHTYYIFHIHNTSDTETSTICTVCTVNTTQSVDNYHTMQIWIYFGAFSGSSCAEACGFLHIPSLKSNTTGLQSAQLHDHAPSSINTFASQVWTEGILLKSPDIFLQVSSWNRNFLKSSWDSPPWELVGNCLRSQLQVSKRSHRISNFWSLSSLQIPHALACHFQKAHSLHLRDDLPFQNRWIFGLDLPSLSVFFQNKYGKKHLEHQKVQHIFFDLK